MAKKRGYRARRLATVVAAALLLYPPGRIPNSLRAREALLLQHGSSPPSGDRSVPVPPPQVAASPWTSAEDDDQPSGILVKLKNRLAPGSAEGLFAQHNLKVVKRLPHIDVWLVASSEMSAPALMRRLERSSDVLWAEPNGRVSASGIIPNDNFYQAQQWNLRLIGLPEAWAFTTGDARPIAVIDTGIDLDHSDLGAKIWANPGEVPDNGLDDDDNGYVDDVGGWNFITGSTLMIEEPHGTHVAGIAGAHTDNDVGVAGVSWQSTIMPLQVLRGDSGTYADVAEAVVYAADNGARILNLSLGGEEPSGTIELATAYARDRDCLVVAAVGNNIHQPTPVEYPAALPGVLAVAATTDSDAPWGYSNRGPEVDVAAPGVDIFSTSSYGRYAEMSGTSMATPHVSGLAALIWALQPTLTADQVAHVITTTAHDVYTSGWDPRTGWGRIDAYTAILAARPDGTTYLPVISRQSTGEL